VAVLDVGAVLLGQHHARDVDLAPADVAVQVDPAWHHDPAGEVDDLVGAAVGGRRYDPATLDPQVHEAAVDPAERVVDCAARELGPHQGVCPPSRAERVDPPRCRAAPERTGPGP
jgi:hypothetical protein